ncbi:hypothetical protein FHS18_005784 [Paenibacillus phyllosphaerae]|uniref:Cysteine-rich CWC n=1 Tax=Paenibacillus phyllosphaerae TaxID=274593 RepID=A0A7W5B489_9BACL|nr:cysteine-rich CWC family protein [Paenibacillus phyllosphaerae]MBB3113671.1 hypothetical protein [Paenibacillus phyllosphaerae]
MNCPLCGKDSNCGYNQADPASTRCWCFHASFPPEIFEQIPAELRKKACICQTCLEQFRMNPSRTEIS